MALTQPLCLSEAMWTTFPASLLMFQVGGMLNSSHLACGCAWLQVCDLQCPDEHGPVSTGSRVNADCSHRLGFPRLYSSFSGWSLKAGTDTAAC